MAIGDAAWVGDVVRTARAVFKPSRPDRVVDETIEALQIARSLVGVGAIVWVTFAYWDSDEAMREKIGELTLSVSILVFAVPLVLIAFVAAARGAGRDLYLSRIGSPLMAVGVMVAAYLVAFRVCPAIGLALPDWDLVPMLIGILVLLPVFAVANLFLLVGAFFSVVSVFRVADVHEVLPPLISPFLVWGIFFIQLFDPPMAGVPTALRVLFLIVPPLTGTLLSYWELRRLRTQHGITLNQALNHA
ncbi:hypothetical protein [Streptomyces sp. KLOTTS4A1]|uniref:hypothetical protein n=1 Tax=Streptomyces sp. KLOTTS4A1 TaxID=3390996 RepID=UPI0039F50B2B